MVKKNNKAKSSEGKKKSSTYQVADCHKITFS